MCGADCLALGNPMRGPSSASSFAWSFGSRASHLLRQGTWGTEAGREGIRPPPQAGTRFRSPRLSGPLLLPGGERAGDLLLLVELHPLRLFVWVAIFRLVTAFRRVETIARCLLTEQAMTTG